MRLVGAGVAGVVYFALQPWLTPKGRCFLCVGLMMLLDHSAAARAALGLAGLVLAVCCRAAADRWRPWRNWQERRGIRRDAGLRIDPEQCDHDADPRTGFSSALADMRKSRASAALAQAVRGHRAAWPWRGLPLPGSCGRAKSPAQDYPLIAPHLLEGLWPVSSAAQSSGPCRSEGSARDYPPGDLDESHPQLDPGSAFQSPVGLQGRGVWKSPAVGAAFFVCFATG